MVTTDVTCDIDSCNLEPCFWLIKLSVLPVSVRALTECLLTSILTTAYCKPCKLAADMVSSVG